jgi:hypothetical protein
MNRRGLKDRRGSRVDDTTGLKTLVLFQRWNVVTFSQTVGMNGTMYRRIKPRRQYNEQGNARLTDVYKKSKKQRIKDWGFFFVKILCMMKTSGSLSDFALYVIYLCFDVLSVPQTIYQGWTQRCSRRPQVWHAEDNFNKVRILRTKYFILFYFCHKLNLFFPLCLKSSIFIFVFTFLDRMATLKEKKVIW